MNLQDFVTPLREYLNNNLGIKRSVINILLKTDAVVQMLQFLYFDNRKLDISKANCYSLFFNSARAIRYCEVHGIEIPSEEAAKHRIPFIVSILESLSFVNTTRSNISICGIMINDLIFDDIPQNISLDDIEKSLKKVDGSADEYLKEKIGLELFNSEIDTEVI